MRNILLISTLFVLCSFTKTELKKKTKYLEYRFKEVFYVLKDDATIRQGEYLMNSNENIIQKGTYINNEKSGIWEYFCGDKLEYKYDYDKNKVVSDTLGVARGALYSQGMGYFRHVVLMNLKYPRDAMEEGNAGMVIVKFIIDKEGLAKNFEIDASCGVLSLNNEAIRVAKLAACLNPWLPAINEKGEPVEFIVTWPFSFSKR